MSYRTIMIFPEFDNMQIIDDIRTKYDPLAKLVRPHITLVFPFESDMSNEEVASILDERLVNISPFEVELKGFSKHSDQFGNTLFLDMIKGEEQIVQIHDELYKNEFKDFDLGFNYIPHITVGKLSSVNEMNEAYESIKEIEDSFSTVVNKISVEMIGENEESIIIIEKELNWNRICRGIKKNMIKYGEFITPEEYMELRKMVGWVEFPIEQARACIEKAYMIQCVRDDEKAIGVVRLLWDGGYIAFLSDVIVDPKYQGQGIGRKLVEASISKLKDGMKPGYKVKLTLNSAKGKEPFYEKFGFRVRPNDDAGPGMDQWLIMDEA